MTGFERFSVNDARKITYNFSVAPFVYSLKGKKFLIFCLTPYFYLQIIKQFLRRYL